MKLRNIREMYFIKKALINHQLHREFLDMKKDEEKVKKITNEWYYISPGICIIGNKKLKKKVPLNELIHEFINFYSLSPTIDKEAAKNFATKHNASVFLSHKGIGLTCQEYFTLLFRYLAGIAGLTSEEFADSEKIEQSLDMLGIAPDGSTDKPLISHTVSPNEDESLEVRIKTPVMIGDILNIVGFHLNNLNNTGALNLANYVNSIIYTMGKEGNLTDEEIDNLLDTADECLNIMKNTMNDVRKMGKAKKKGK